MKKFFKYLFFFILIPALNIYAQDQSQQKIDSLQQVLSTAKEDTNKVIILNSLAKTLAKSGNNELAKKNVDDAFHLSKKLNYQNGIAEALSTLGIISWNKGDFKDVMQYLSSALKIKEKIGDKKGVATLYENIGLACISQGNYKEAMENSLSALKIRREIKDNDVGKILFNIASINTLQGNYPTSLKFLYESLRAFESVGNKRSVAMVYMNIGNIYQVQHNPQQALKYVLDGLKIADETGNKKIAATCHINLGIIYDDLENDDEALKHYSTGIEIAKTIGAKREISAANGNIGDIYFKQMNYDKALIYYVAALKVAEEIGDQENIANLNHSIGRYYLVQKKNDNAGRYFLNGYLIAKETGDKEKIKKCLEGLSESEEQLNHFKQALNYHKLYSTYKDSLLNDSSNRQIIEMQTKYETGKKEKEIVSLTKDNAIKELEIKKQKLLKNSFIGGLALVLLLSFFVYNNFRIANKLKLQNIRNRIASDLHDDVGSTLNSISVYSEVAKQKSPTVVNELEQIGDASRKIIEVMSDIVWTINPKNDTFENIIFRMSTLAYNLLKAKDIEHTIRADESLNETKLSLELRRNLYLIFKEALNNLVKYSNATRARITLTKENGLIKLTVQDNGIGFDVTQTSKGNGLLNMKDRAKEMNAKLKIESENGNGTNVELILKG